MPHLGMPAELAEIIATHRALFGGFVMEAQQGSDNGGNNDGETPPGNGFQPITSQADLDRIIGERVKRAKPADYEDLKKKAAKLDEIEESGKTELQKAQDRLAALEAEKQKLQTDLESKASELVRERVAREKGVPAHRISGKDEAELKADADRYLAELSDARKPNHVPTQGTGSPAGRAIESGRERAKKYLETNKL